MNPTTNRGLVLLVEDDDNDAFFFRRAFAKTGFTNPLQLVRDGLEAIQYLSGEGEYADRGRYPLPALTVLDLNTPRRHGIEVLRWIRGHPVVSRSIVVVLTSSSSDVDLEATYGLGVNSYVLKPAESECFLSTVQMIASYWLGYNRAPGRPAAVRRERRVGLES